MAGKLTKQVQGEVLKRLASARRRAEESRTTATMVRGGAALVAGGAMGFAEKKGMPMVIGPVPTRAAIGALALLGEGMTKGMLSAALGGLANASLAVYGYEGAQKGTFIAGTIGSGEQRRTWA